MKKVLAIILALAMVFALCACGNGGNNNGGDDANKGNSDNNGNEQAKDFYTDEIDVSGIDVNGKKIVYIAPSLDIEYWQWVEDGVRQACEEYGVSVTSTSGVLEVQKYVTIWNYSYENDLIVFNSDTLNGLNEATQKVLKEKAVEACNWGRDIVEQEHDQLIQEFRDQGIQVDELTEDQLKVFQDKVADFCQSFYDKYGEEACAAFGITKS